jgi:hypothetical protein
MRNCDRSELQIIFRLDRIFSVRPASDIAWFQRQFPKETIRYRMSGPLKNYQPRRANEREIDRCLQYNDGQKGSKPMAQPHISHSLETLLTRDSFSTNFSSFFSADIGRQMVLPPAVVRFFATGHS